MESRTDSGASTTSTASADNTCVKRAEGASATWGNGLRQFISPPYDINAWSTFRNEVDTKINNTLADCGCSDASCQKASAAMFDLRSLVSDMDSSIRNGSQPPADAVQRQEQIDNQINEAGDLARGGK